MKKILMVSVIFAFSGVCQAGSMIEEPTNLDAPTMAPGLWKMGGQEVCFEAGGAMRIEGQNWKQLGNYSCSGTFCSATLVAVPNHPASANQWKLQLLGQKGDLKLNGTDKANVPVSLTRSKDTCK